MQLQAWYDSDGDGKDLGIIELDRVVAAGIPAGELVEHVLSQNGHASPLGGPGSDTKTARIKELRNTK